MIWLNIGGKNMSICSHFSAILPSIVTLSLIIFWKVKIMKHSAQYALWIRSLNRKGMFTGAKGGLTPRI